ncbi:glycoside hydrolase domain-containing protein [Cellulosimicrobium marinum]|uniref:glycoside hydrolase domain-containing protein n=1 Tax=Cellulosimicrobium marinum TaxID=1638992 RepID=UPI001E3B38A9|nr:glycoside hydrolase domain-containing protein [Cellulosimicrobium marinum]MCB7137376.1 glycoside hydrolase family 92 protein [Cellulosimicrobium marinum]
MSGRMLDHVDPFVGTEATALPPATGIAATWWAPKPQVGNTHPGACHPLGMVSACAYSGAYPTGYGRYDISTEGLPTALVDEHVASGVTHFQQSGTGAIRKYYNYLRVTPMLEPLDALGRTWALHDEVAVPGYYAATLGSGVRCEVTVGPKSAVHRFTFPEHRDARVVVDLSLGGLAIPYGATVPLRAHLATLGPGAAAGEIVVEGAPLAAHLECDAPRWRQMLWYDRRLMPGSTRLEFGDIRPTTLRPFGLVWAGPTRAGQVVELRIGFSLRGTDQAHDNLVADCGPGPESFTVRRATTSTTWDDHLELVEVDGVDDDRRSVFATALYHSLVKPCLAPDESPFWPTDGPFAYDLSTMWDIYRTQLPLLTTFWPERAVELATALLHICEEEGNFPVGYRMARGADRFSRQASALAQTFLADLCALDLPGLDWDWALVHMHNDLRRTYGEDYLLQGVAHPISHTLDLAFGYWCTERVARRVGDAALADELARLAAGWVNAFDPGTGLLRDSTYYEGGRWNYSFRLLHDMAGRIALAGGDDAFVALLDRFFGYGAEPVVQPGERPGPAEMAAGYALDRFEGLNNEPDMEAPWAYHYAGRPDRTAEVVHAAVHQRFGTGPGGLPGNDDSGALSSWYVWASLGLFPVAGQALFLVNAPAFCESRLHLPGGVLTVETTGFAPPGPDTPPQYVRAAWLDGRPLTRTWLPASTVRRGGRLLLELGPEPSAWGTDPADRPPSTPPPAPPTTAPRETP